MYIDSQSDLLLYKQQVSGKVVCAVPLLCSNKQHLAKNEIIALYITCDGAEYVFPYKHAESIYNDYTIEELIENTICYFYNKLALDYSGIALDQVYDLELAHYLNTSKPLQHENINTEHFYSRLHTQYSKTNTLVSLSNFIRYARIIASQAKLSQQHGLKYYDKLQRLLYQVESSGIQTDKQYFTALYGTPVNLIDDKVYTKYNFYTTTGRPSNRFGGINFAALNKTDDTRRSFMSRFPDGKLVELDFKAYHPHIIAYLCNYDFENQDVYEHLAQFYFNTKTPSKEQINSSKELTFNQVYGGINRKYLAIPFFAKAKELTSILYAMYREQGYVESNISGRHFQVADDDDLTDTKLFNYYIQMTETELNGIYLEKLFSEIDKQQALPILYTYDAVVFDCKNDYIKELVDKIIGSTTSNFPITVKIGDNYKEMTNYI